MKHGYWQSIAESPTEMFWMKNHSSAYFIMPRWPILGKFMIFIPRFSDKILCSIHQRCQPTPPNFENKSIKVANLSLQASLWTLHELGQSLTHLLKRLENFSNVKLIVAYWNNQYSVRRVKSKISWWRKRVDLYFSKQDNLVIDKFQAKISCWIKNEKNIHFKKIHFSKKNAPLKRVGLWANLVCCPFDCQSALHRWNDTAANQEQWENFDQIKFNFTTFWGCFYFPAGTCEVKWNLLRPRGEENWCTTTQKAGARPTH